MVRSNADKFKTQFLLDCSEKNVENIKGFIFTGKKQGPCIPGVIINYDLNVSFGTSTHDPNMNTKVNME